ncbi:hypothetical protein L1887_32123 [Cichorium endivia]|nr:hypothetical protein L1887_32123 [Cichorium endivia]
MLRFHHIRLPQWTPVISGETRGWELIVALDTIHYPQDLIGIWGYEYLFHEDRSSCGFSESNNRYQYHEQVANVHSNNWDYCASSSVMHNQSIVGRRKRTLRVGRTKKNWRWWRVLREMVVGFEAEKIAPLMAVPVREMVAILKVIMNIKIDRYLNFNALESTRYWVDI